MGIDSEDCLLGDEDLDAKAHEKCLKGSKRFNFQKKKQLGRYDNKYNWQEKLELLSVETRINNQSQYFKIKKNKKNLILAGISWTVRQWGLSIRIVDSLLLEVFQWVDSARSDSSIEQVLYCMYELEENL